jgi:T5SS/PEP-CTERM-associated repeat protein
LTVGESGSGGMSISAGGAVTSTDGAISDGLDGLNSVTVSDSGSNWIMSGDLTLSRFGTGTLLVKNGGLVQCVNGTLGSASPHRTGEVSVEGVNSKWINTGELTVGGPGHGTLDVTGGGAVSSVNGLIARESTSNSTATVAGVDSSWTMTGKLSLGGDAGTNTAGGAAEPNINPGGLVTATEAVIFEDGSLNLQGGTLDEDSTIGKSAGSKATPIRW